MPYASSKEFLSDLQEALEEGYGSTFYGVALEEAGNNVNAFLRTFL